MGVRRMSEIDVFFQAEGLRDITLVRIPSNATARELLEVARVHGAVVDETTAVYVEDSEEPLHLGVRLEAAGVGQHSRVHAHRCRKVNVAINFDREQKSHAFPAAATVGRVFTWATGKHGFDLPEVDAVEHLLQLCGSADRPDEDAHIGTLTQASACTVCFDLVPKQRVEG